VGWERVTTASPDVAPLALLFQVDAAFSGPLSLPSVTEITGFLDVRAHAFAPARDRGHAWRLR
jgi:hypothetical protein